MSSITAQQTKLDLKLEPKEKRLEIGKCNGRLNPGKKQREPTFQVILDALALTPFRMDKKKKFDLNLEIFRDIFQICPRVHGQNFDELPTDEVIMSFFKELGHTREIKSITDDVVDQMHLPWRTFATIITRSLSGKTTGLDKLRLSRAQILWGMYYKKNVDYVELLWEDFTYQIDNRVTPPKKARKFKKPASPKLTTVPASPKEPIKKSKRVKRPAKKSTNAPTKGVVIRDTPGVSISKKKAPAKADRGKGNEQETHKLLASGSSEGVDFESKVTDESKAKYSNTNSEDDNESDDTNDEGSQNDDEGYNDAQDSERTDSDEEENPNPNLNVDEEEETQEEEYIHTPDYYVPTDEEIDDENMEFYDEEYDDLYKDVNVRSKVAEHEEVGKGYVEMTDATRESGSQEKSYEQVIEDAHVTLTTSED
ncbi:hypothetical protein Tco_0479022 [Tanacetum coccineum]